MGATAGQIACPDPIIRGGLAVIPIKEVLLKEE
jgi:hypothetical protein